jgi:hypothetical protein
MRKSNSLVFSELRRGKQSEISAPTIWRGLVSTNTERVQGDRPLGRGACAPSYRSASDRSSVATTAASGRATVARLPCGRPAGPSEEGVCERARERQRGSLHPAARQVVKDRAPGVRRAARRAVSAQGHRPRAIPLRRVCSRSPYLRRRPLFAAGRLTEGTMPHLHPRLAPPLRPPFRALFAPRPMQRDRPTRTGPTCRSCMAELRAACEQHRAG